MKVINGDMFVHCKSGDALCVTTNGVINKAGGLVMGAGIAKTFRDRFKGTDKILGEYVSKYGNRVFRISPNETVVIHDEVKLVTLFSFPTKHNWKDKSDLDLIEKSCIQLKDTIRKFNIQGDIYLPAPGCSHGGLDWETQVKPVIEKHLNEDRYLVCFHRF